MLCFATWEYCYFQSTFGWKKSMYKWTCTVKTHVVQGSTVYEVTIQMAVHFSLEAMGAERKSNIYIKLKKNPITLNLTSSKIVFLKQKPRKIILDKWKWRKFATSRTALQAYVKVLELKENDTRWKLRSTDLQEETKYMGMKMANMWANVKDIYVQEMSLKNILLFKTICNKV